MKKVYFFIMICQIVVLSSCFAQRHLVVDEILTHQKSTNCKGSLFVKVSKDSLLKHFDILTYFEQMNGLSEYEIEKDFVDFMIKKFHITKKNLNCACLTDFASREEKDIYSSNKAAVNSFIEFKYKSNILAKKDFDKISKYNFYNIGWITVPQSWFVFYDKDSIVILHREGARVDDKEIKVLLHLFEKYYSEQNRAYIIFKM